MNAILLYFANMDIEQNSPIFKQCDIEYAMHSTLACKQVDDNSSGS